MKFFAILALICSPAVAVPNAHALESQPATLALTMRAMNNDLKAISTQATVTAKNADSARLAADFVTLVQHAETFTPDSVASLPSSQQPARLAVYRQMLDGVLNQGRALELAFQNNQNSAAVALLQKLAQMKSDGHKEFN